MSTVVELIKVALRILSIAWDVANDAKVEGDIEAIQKDLQKLKEDIQSDIDANASLTKDIPF